MIMVKKRFFLGMLVFGLTLIACENDTTNVTNKTALVTAISNAEAAITANDPVNVLEWEKCIPTSAKTDLESVIAAAQAVNTNAAATQAQVDAAASTLNDAATTFNASPKIAYGTKPGAIGGTGPAGGIIFYVDTDDAYPGWKYLEAAPADISGTKTWASTSYQSTSISGTETAIGSGAANTRTILATDADAPAAKACADYVSGGYDDWFLPSKDELNLMYTNLKQQGLGDFGDTFYWSSSQSIASSSWYLYFSEDFEFYSIKGDTLSVRAVRAF
jgi:hypothetical protein